MRSLNGTRLRFLVFLAVLAAILAYVTWKWPAFNRETTRARPAPATRSAAVRQPTPPPAVPQPLDFFQEMRLDRERARSEEEDLLRSVADDPRATDAAREKAGTELIRISDRIAREARAEDLLKAKGYQDALVQLQADGATAVVEAPSLSAADVARIADAVSRAAGVKPEDVNILAEDGGPSGGPR